MNKLSDKQKQFVRAYVKTNNATKAATKAGYKHPKQQGSRLLTRVAIKRAIKRLQKRSTDKTVMSITASKAWLTKMIKSADLNESAKHGDALKALDLLAKLGGNYITKVEVRNFEDKTPEELEMAVIANLKAKGYKITKPKGKNE